MEGPVSNDVINPKTVLKEVELKILSEIADTVQKAAPIHDVLETIVKEIGHIVDYRSASIFSHDKKNNQLEEVMTIGRRVDLIDFVSFDMGNGISAWVAKQKRPITLNNVRKSKGGTHTRSFLSVPIMFGDEVSGVINFAHDEADAFTVRDADVIKVFSNFIALILERIDHNNEISRLRSANEQLQSELENSRKMIQNLEKAKGNSDLVTIWSQKINNPLAIIAGNAQFLLMTMKNSSGSVVKRLKAIDHEASNIISITEQVFNSQNSPNTKITMTVKNEIIQINKS
jgi:transcriptional regulator with GAF, ATPase, and Fis domain